MIPSVQKENQFVDVMKWGEPEWKIQNIPNSYSEAIQFGKPQLVDASIQ